MNHYFQLCVLLLVAVWCSAATSSEEPYVIYAQSVRQSKSLDETLIDPDEVSIAAVDSENQNSEILDGLLESLDEDEEERKEKSLLNSFPFNQAEQNHHGEGHGHDHANHGDHGQHSDHSAHSNHAAHGDHQTTIEDRGVVRSPLRQQLSNSNSGLGQSQIDQDFLLKM